MKRKTLVSRLAILIGAFLYLGLGVSNLHAEYGEENLAPEMINDIKTQDTMWNYLKKHSKSLNGTMIFWKAKVTKLYPNPDYPGAFASLIVNRKPDSNYRISFFNNGIIPEDSNGTPSEVQVGDVVRVMGTFLFYEKKVISIVATHITIEK